MFISRLIDLVTYLIQMIADTCYDFLLVAMEEGFGSKNKMVLAYQWRYVRTEPHGWF